MDARTRSVSQRTRSKTDEKLKADYLERKKEKAKSKIPNAKNAAKRKKGDEGKEEEELNLKRRGIDSDVHFVSKVFVESESDRNGCDDDGTDSDVEIVSGEFFSGPPKRGGSDGNRVARSRSDRSEENSIPKRETDYDVEIVNEELSPGPPKKVISDGNRVTRSRNGENRIAERGTDFDIDIVNEEFSPGPSKWGRSDGNRFTRSRRGRRDENRITERGTGSDIEILNEELSPGPPKRGKSDGNRFTRSRRDRSDENRITEWGNTEESGRAQLSIGSTKEDRIVETSGSSDSDFSSSGEEEDDPDDNDYEENSGSSDMLSDSSSPSSEDLMEGEEKDDCNISPEERKDYDDNEGNIIGRKDYDDNEGNIIGRKDYNDPDDNDYEENSGSSDTLSDGLSQSSEDVMEEGEEKDDCNISPEERKDYNDDEGDITKTEPNFKEHLVGVIAREEHVGGTEHGYKKIRKHGLEMWINSIERDNVKQQRRSIRLRPRSVPESKKKKLKLGTYSQPLPVRDNEDSDSSDGDLVEKSGERSYFYEDCDSSDEDDGYCDPVAKSSKRRYKKVEKLSTRRAHGSKAVDINNTINTLGDSILGEGGGVNGILPPDSSDEDGGYSDPVAKSRKRRYKKVEKFSKRRAHGSKSVDINNTINTLVDLILGQGGGVNDILPPDKANAAAHNVLPSKFGFEDGDPALPEKDECEKEIDGLFAEMDMCLSLLDTDANISSMIEDAHATGKTLSPEERCQLGDHPELILEEPIGIICKCCNLVYMEMRDIFPELLFPAPGKRDSFYCGRGGSSEFWDFHLDDSGCEIKDPSSVQTEGPVLNLIPFGMRKSMYGHQLDGFEFLWKNVVGETRIEKLKSSYSSTEGSGCMISHAPGTGKTCLSIVFIMSLLKIYPDSRPVIVAPCSMLLTWEKEFEKWKSGFRFHNLNSDEGNEAAALDSLVVKGPNGTQFRRSLLRAAKLHCWEKQTSVLGVSYGLFEKLVNGHHKEIYEEKMRKHLLELPGLLVLDEGHTPRNNRSQRWKALKEVKTRRRIILSGTPFQNTLDELYNTLSLVNPELSKLKFRVNSLADGIDKRNDSSIAKLKAMIDPLVHVHKGNILQASLPGLKDMVVFLRPTTQQRSLLKLISETDFRYPFDKGHLVSLVSVHPSLAALKESLLRETGLRLPDADTRPYAGVKTKFVMELVKLCDAFKERVLIFSEKIDPLNFIKEQLRSRFSWIEGKEVLFMDGKQKPSQRQGLIDSLNSPASDVKVFLASTKACSEGINLVGASRVVLLDVVWNPSVERQAISRAYRLGQTKVVYVYHLITAGTSEVDKFVRQTEKYRLSELVFSCRDRKSKKENISAAVAEDKILEAMIDNSNLNGMFEEIVHNPKESNLFEDFSFC